MRGGGAKSGSGAVAAHPVPYYDWAWHPQNKWWTFQKGEGKTHTRFGRFEGHLFVTGWRGCLLLVACRLLLAACCLPRLLLVACDLTLLLVLLFILLAGNPTTQAPPSSGVVVVAAAAAAATDASAGASKTRPVIID